MAQSRFEMGMAVKLVADFKTPKTATPPSTLIDPTSITLTIQRPDKTLDTRVYGVGAITKTAVGKYFATLLLSQDGTYRWRWLATNGSDVVGVKSGSFDSYREPNF